MAFLSFLTRLRRAFAKADLQADDHLVFFSRLSEDEFLDLTQRAAVILDSILWSGGNSALEALSCNRPIVTLAGPLMRGRHTYGILRRARIDELIAANLDEYVEIAVRLGIDAKWRSSLTEKIREHKVAECHDRAAIAGLEDFLLKCQAGLVPFGTPNVYDDLKL